MNGAEGDYEHEHRYAEHENLRVALIERYWGLPRLSGDCRFSGPSPAAPTPPAAAGGESC